MNKIIIPIIIFVLVAGGVLFFVFSSGEDEPSSSTQPVTSTQADEPVAQEEEAVVAESAAAGEYVEYSQEAVDAAEGTKILFFHASWCPTCQALDQNINAGKVPEGVSIFKLDYDTENDLRNKYGVTYQHTLVQIDDAGNELTQWYGSYTIDQIMDQVI